MVNWSSFGSHTKGSTLFISLYSCHSNFPPECPSVFGGSIWNSLWTVRSLTLIRTEWRLMPVNTTAVSGVGTDKNINEEWCVWSGALKIKRSNEKQKFFCISCANEGKQSDWGICFFSESCFIFDPSSWNVSNIWCLMYFQRKDQIKKNHK